MVICSCVNANERKVREALQKGARTLADLQQEIGVAMGCGRCCEAICDAIYNYYSSSQYSDLPTRVPQTA